MGFIRVRHKGDFSHFEKFVNRVLKRDYLNIITVYAEQGLALLKEATPVVSGETRAAWNYEIESRNGRTTLWYTNGEEDNDINIVILLLYGHGTKNGSYVEGIDFVSPALEPVFRNLADEIFWSITTE